MEPTPDLTQRPPRSPRARLGGYVLLPRMLDKGRAELAGKNGEYHYNCPLDQRFLEYAGIDPEQLKQQLANGLGDGEILAWVQENSTTKPKPWEIAQWSAFMEQRGPDDVETKQYFAKMLGDISTTRADIATWADLLDLDDYVTFGGKP
ncbi:DUF5069 domain-containing protein [Luteolibacter pohnpeiensis]|uniref:DUF5069 domain-containing protein n=1 Tax=Luteolibacter pohnpeiensis TaxID=454153 RepID=A0A934VWS4_9BACT|nr:DUF5069 domain-containing protein [Luteolibacter pohnpeiensis]MBK1882814.1 DUF5069 domain-containing protein [Luteolibacter pohnpeiensis]